MEERLFEIITHCSPESSLPFADGVLGFIQHQLVELVRDCLDKSQRGLVTSMYFAELQEKLEKLLHEVSTLHAGCPPNCPPRANCAGAANGNRWRWVKCAVRQGHLMAV